MKQSWVACWALVLVLAGCSADAGRPSGSIVSEANLGKQITVEGWAVNRKGGAQLLGGGFDLWIAGLESWPDGYYTGGDRGKRVKVTGVLAEDHGLPVFVPKKDDPIVQGIPVPEGTDLKKASHRYLVKNAKWELMEN
ncbi:MAG: hypothetical protein A2Z34_01615 [Planctomycetes bacterium RBG_16_59_8]|nr:MAG: hypothetical protein A2Z34_01615 [Planctomycetes bacterium RBG_16_59_8]